MLKQAYQQGVLQAYAEAGLIKEAGTGWEVLKATGRGIRDSAAGSLNAIRGAVIQRNLLEAAGKSSSGPIGRAATRMAKDLANKAILQHAKPWLHTGGILGASAAAGYGGYQGAKKLFPKAFKDED